MAVITSIHNGEFSPSHPSSAGSLEIAGLSREMSRKTYIETFEDGPGGWLGWDASGPCRLEFEDGAAISRGPWWVDSNHAPPGGGYLHLLFCLHTHSSFYGLRNFGELGGTNRFVEGGFQCDFTDARLTLRLKGNVDWRGSKLLLLAQAKVGDLCINSVLQSQPFAVDSDWTEQTVTLAADDEQWKCLGARHDATDDYGWGPIAPILRDLNCDIILILHPLDVVAAGQFDSDLHRNRAERDYAVDRSRLPNGEVLLDEVRVEFA